MHILKHLSIVSTNRNRMKILRGQWKDKSKVNGTRTHRAQKTQQYSDLVVSQNL